MEHLFHPMQTEAIISPYVAFFSPYAPGFVCVIFFFRLQWVAICQMSANELSDSNIKAYFQKYYYEFIERELAFHSNYFWWLSCGPFSLLRQ
jgi:hypothetical protein